MNDKLDSALFSRNDHTIDQLQKNYAYAMAVINESLVFNPEPFTMSAPQLIDGFIVSDSSYRKFIFDLIGKGFVKIAIYNVGNNAKVTDLWQYMGNFVANRKYIFSSRPLLTEKILQNDKSFNNEMQKVWNYILDPDINTEHSLGSEELALEIKDMTEFFRELRDVEKIRKSDIYVLNNIAVYHTFSEFIQSSLENLTDSELKTLFGIWSLNPDTHENLMKGLFSCKTRTDIRNFLSLFGNENDIPENTIKNIRNIFEVLYNQYTLSNFSRSELHIPILENREQEIFNKLITGQNKTSDIRFQYENTEILSETNEAVLTTETILSMREDIMRISENNNCNWEKALELYHKDLYSVAGIKYDESNPKNRKINISSKKKKYNFQSVVEAAEKIDFINNKEESFISW